MYGTWIQTMTAWCQARPPLRPPTAHAHGVGDPTRHAREHTRSQPCAIRIPQTGFTLIELLVVISIIAILAAMLLPAIRLVKGSANAQKCLSAQRQCALGCFAYSVDNDGAIPSLMLNPGPPMLFWSNLIFPNYLEVKKDTDQTHNNYLGSVLQGCPDWVAGYVKTTSPAGAYVWDMAFGINRFPQYDPTMGNQYDSYFGSTSLGFVEFNLARITKHSSRLLLADSQSPTGGSQAYVANWGGPNYTEASTLMKTWHGVGQKMNVTFFDGHGEKRTHLEAINAINAP